MKDSNNFGSQIMRYVKKGCCQVHVIALLIYSIKRKVSYGIKCDYVDE